MCELCPIGDFSAQCESGLLRFTKPSPARAHSSLLANATIQLDYSSF